MPQLCHLRLTARILWLQASGIPCSLSQEQMVLLSMQEGGVAYNQAFCFQLDHNVDHDLLSQALMALIDRHEPLRTGFTMDQAGLKQTIAPSAADCGFQLESRDMGTMSPAEVARDAEEGTLEKMDLRHPPLMAAKLFQVSHLMPTPIMSRRAPQAWSEVQCTCSSKMIFQYAFCC